MATGASSCPGCEKVRGVAVEICNHVTCGVPNGGVGIEIGIVEEPQGCIIGFFGVVTLLGREGAKGDNHVGISGNGVIKECDNYTLHKVNVLQGK